MAKKSALEKRLHDGPLKGYEYEPKWARLEYKAPGKYTPDFASKKDKNIVYEAKGRFRTYTEAKKYLAVKADNPHITIRFIITNPDVKAYPQSKGITLGEWLDKYGFPWCTEDTIPDDWRK